MQLSPIDNVTLAFGAILGLAVARTLPSCVSYYAWFKSSGLDLANYRGYGHGACRLFGIIPAPFLSVRAMAVSGVAFLALIIAPAAPGLLPAPWRAPAYLAALAFYHLYFSQLYCEAHIGAHVTVLIPPALILLALSPALDESPGAPAEAAAFTCWLMKIILTSAYCGAGVCKITHSLRSLARGGSSWCTGSTLQAFIFEAMFLSTPRTHSSFGVPTPFSYTLQKLHLLYPRTLLMPASFVAVAFETFAPLMLLAPAHIASVPFALVGLKFHYGIALLQNIDFVSWWAAAYAFLLADPAAWSSGLLVCPVDGGAALGLAATVSAALETAPLRASLALAYVSIHVAATVLLRFFPDVEILPLSSFPMFGTPQNVFDRRLRKHFWLTHKPHATGTLKNYAFPFTRPHTVLPEEIAKLPFNYLLLSHGGSEKPELHSNVEVTPELQAALDKIQSLGNQEPDTFATDSSAAPAILLALEQAKAAFDAAPRVAPEAPLVAATPLTEAALASDDTDSAARELPSTTAWAVPSELPLGERLRLCLVRSVISAAIALFSAVDLIFVGVFAARDAARRAIFGGPARAEACKPAVVVVGGSFAGLRVQRDLSADFDVTLIDPKEYFEYTPGVLRLFTQPHKLLALTAQLPRKHNRLIVGEATSVSSEVVSVRDAATGETVELPYDYLVLACGAGYPCATVKPAMAETTLEARQATWNAASTTLVAAKSVVVVGGGLVGVELAAEIVEAHPRKPLTLLTGGDVLCGTLPRSVGRASLAWLVQRGVTVRFHAAVDDVDTGAVRLASGEVLCADIVYDCRGNGPGRAATLLKDGAASAATDAKGRVLVDETLRCAAGSGRIFVAGDAMSLPSSDDLKLGHTAELNADVVADNIRHLCHAAKGGAQGVATGLATYPFGAVGASKTPRVSCVSLGEGYGVLSFNGLVIDGALAAVVKALLEWTKIAACAERPVGVAFWKFGDAAANWISRTILSPPTRLPAVRPLVLYDGVCLLCSTFVQFVLDNDEEEIIDFAPLQVPSHSCRGSSVRRPTH